MAIESPHIDGEGLYLTTIGLDSAEAETVQQVASREAVKVFIAIDDYSPTSANTQLACRLAEAGALVCLIDFDAGKDVASKTAAAIQTWANGRATLIALSADQNPELILSAMRAGCTEYLRKPLQADELASCLQKMRMRWMAASLRSRPARGRILGFLGVRGGAGATTVAVHLGTFLARSQSQKTLIIDHHLPLGHVAMLLGTDSHGYGFLDLVANIARIDPTLLSSYVAHHGSGLDVLASPESLNQASVIPADSQERAIRFVADLYDFVLIDCPSGMGEDNQVIARCSDDLYLVATPELPALRDLARYIARLAELAVPPDKIKVIINRQEPRRTVTVDQIEQAIGRPVNLIVPSSTADLIRAVDVGEPILPGTKSGFADQLTKWACGLAPVAETTIDRKWRFAFWS